MKVFFFISVMGHGRGGHFHSLNHIAHALSEHVDAHIISVGPGHSQIISNHKCFYAHIDTKEMNFLDFKKEIREILRRECQDIIHCFDSNVFNLLRLVLYPNKSRIVVNLCGGPNPRFFPKVSHLVLFSEENKIWFQSKRKFKNTSIYLIPNRVNKENFISTSSHPIKKDNEKFTFLRISRIGSVYKKSINDSIKLVEKLKNSNIDNILLYIIGAIENQEVYEELRIQAEGLPIRFLTEDEYTNRASDMLYLADAVIATGRGVMEATAWGKPVLVPVANSEVPVLMKEDNFNEFFKVNFSQRSIASTQTIAENIEQICNIVLNIDENKRISDFSRDLFSKKFDAKEGCKEYLKVYNDLMMSKIRYSIFDDFFYQSYYFYKFYKFFK